MNLYQLTRQYQALLNDEGELTEDWDTRLGAVEDAITSKIDSICKLIRARQANAEAIDAEILRLKQLKGRYEREADNLGKWVCQCIGADKVDTGLFRVYARQSEVVEILDESLIPEAYMRHKVIEEVKPAKDEIKRDLKLGADIPGATLKKNYSLAIK